MKSYTCDALENEYYSNSSYNPESLHNCHNTSLDSTTGGPVIIEKLDNGTNIVWNCVSPDSSLTSSNSKDKTVNTETGQINQISSETNKLENTPQLDRNVNGLETPCAIISDTNTAKNDGALVEISTKHNDANDDELNSIENFESEDIQDVVKEEIVKIGAIRVHSDVKPEETEINACDERVGDEDITETQSEILADDENTIDKANTVKITKSDDANEVTNVIGDIVQSDDGTQSDVDEVFEEKEIIDNNLVKSSGPDTEKPGETTDEENNTVELTVSIDLPNADKMLSSEDFVNDNIAYSKKMDSVVNMDNNNIYSNNARDLDSDLKSDLNEARVFLPRRRSSSTQQLSRNDFSEEQEGDLDSGLEKKAFRSPLSSVDQLIEILASQTEREKSPEKTESESSDTQSDLEKSTAENKCEKDSCENLTTEITSFGAPENPPEKAVKTENNGETSLGSPEEFVKSENNEFIDSLYEPPCLKDGEDKSDEHEVCPELQDSNSNEIESNDKNPEEAKSESSQVVENETEEKLLQSLNQLHDSIKIFTNSLKEKGKSKKLENQCDEGEEISSTTKSPGGDQQSETEVNNVAEVKEQQENEFIDSLYEPTSLKDSLYETTSLKDSLYEQGNLKDEQQIEVQKEQKNGSPVKYIPQMVSQPVFFDSNYEEVTESKSENKANQSDVIVAPSCGGFFLSDVEQSETMYTQSPEGTQGPPGGERGEITYTWAEYPNRAPRTFRNSPHVRESDKTSNRDGLLTQVIHQTAKTLLN